MCRSRAYTYYTLTVYIWKGTVHTDYVLCTTVFTIHVTSLINFLSNRVSIEIVCSHKTVKTPRKEQQSFQFAT